MDFILSCFQIWQGILALLNSPTSLSLSYLTIAMFFNRRATCKQHNMQPYGIIHFLNVLWFHLQYFFEQQLWPSHINMNPVSSTSVNGSEYAFQTDPLTTQSFRLECCVNCEDTLIMSGLGSILKSKFSSLSRAFLVIIDSVIN